MGLDNDLYTLLNASWVVLTIAKPTFHLNLDNPRPQTRHLYIQTQFEGTFGNAVHDNSLSDKVQPFELTFYEGSEDDIIKTLKVVKKLLMEASVTNGKYQIKNSNITEQNQLKMGKLRGELLKFVASDDY